MAWAETGITNRYEIVRAYCTSYFQSPNATNDIVVAQLQSTDKYM